MSKTTIAGYLDAIVWFLTILAALPYTLGDAANTLSPEWKARIAVTGLFAGAVLKIITGHVSQDSKKKDPPEPPAPKP